MVFFTVTLNTIVTDRPTDRHTERPTDRQISLLRL